MTFKDVSYLKLWWHFCSMHQNHLCNFGRGHHWEQIREIDLKLTEDFVLKISSLELEQPLSSAVYNHLCNFIYARFI